MAARHTLRPSQGHHGAPAARINSVQNTSKAGTVKASEMEELADFAAMVDNQKPRDDIYTSAEGLKETVKETV